MPWWILVSVKTQDDKQAKNCYFKKNRNKSKIKKKSERDTVGSTQIRIYP